MIGELRQQSLLFIIVIVSSCSSESSESTAYECDDFHECIPYQNCPFYQEMVHDIQATPVVLVSI